MRGVPEKVTGLTPRIASGWGRRTRPARSVPVQSGSYRAPSARPV
jgi:hypothetical protein